MNEDLLTPDELFADLDASPEVRARRERLALARAVGDALIGYRIAHKLSQRALAARLGLKQSAVARLEASEHNPTFETLERLAGVLGLRFVVDFGPAGAQPAKLPKGVRVVHDAPTSAGGRTLVAAG